MKTGAPISMPSAGRLSFSHKRRANSVALPLVSHESVRLKIVKRKNVGRRAFSVHEFPQFSFSGLQLPVSGEHFGFCGCRLCVHRVGGLKLANLWGKEHVGNSP